MSVVWSMSVWAAVMVLTAAGYGRRYWSRYRVRTTNATMLIVLVGVLSFINPVIHHPELRINLGFLALGLASLVLCLSVGQRAWGVLWIVLSALAIIVRGVAPIGRHQVQLLPFLPIEAGLLGILSGIGLSDPVAGSVVAVGAQFAGSLWIMFQERQYVLGYHDLSVTVLSAVFAWIAGWTWDHAQRLGTRRS